MANHSKGRNRDHDDFIKGILSLDPLVLLLFHRYIPADLKPYIDFSSLRAFPEAHIDNKLIAQYSDCIRECDLVTQQLPKPIQDLTDLPRFRFCFLLEHKSSKPTEPIEGQVERYRYAIVGSDLKNGREPSIIIAIVLYHGKTKWTKKSIYDYYESYLPPVILQYLPRPRYIFIDIENMTNEEIEEMIDLNILRGAFIALKNTHDPKFFRNNISEVLKFVETSSPEIVFQSFLKMLLEYTQRRSKMDADEFIEMVEQKLEPHMAINIKTIFEVAEERGEQRGYQRGEQKGREEGREEGEKEKAKTGIVNMLKMKMFSLEQIADVLEVELTFVKKIQEEWLSSLSK